MRYWMLTAVLLAFWLGRETGAENKVVLKLDKLKVGTIEANRIVVTGKHRTQIDGDGVQVGYPSGEGGRVLVTPRKVLVYGPKLPVARLSYHQAFDSGTLYLRGSANGSTRLWARKDRLVVADDANQPRLEAQYEGGAASIRLRDATGKVQAQVSEAK